MNYMKIINKYIFPISIIILLVAFLIWASTTKEGFSGGCYCPPGSTLKNGGCYSCEAGYLLSDDYYNTRCIKNDQPSKPPIFNKIICN